MQPQMVPVDVLARAELGFKRRIENQTQMVHAIGVFQTSMKTESRTDLEAVVGTEVVMFLTNFLIGYRGELEQNVEETKLQLVQVQAALEASRSGIVIPHLTRNRT